MFTPKKGYYFGLDGWFVSFMFDGQERLYMRSEGNPVVFTNEAACQNFCDCQNFINA